MNAKLIASITMIAVLAVATNVIFANSAYAADTTKSSTKITTPPPPATKPKITTITPPAPSTKKTNSTKSSPTVPPPVKPKITTVTPPAPTKPKTNSTKITPPLPAKPKKITTVMPPTKTNSTTSNAPVTQVLVEITKSSSDSKGDCDTQKTYFKPSAINIAHGSTVTWKNADSAAHTVTASDGSFDSSLINAGGSFKHIFATAGAFDYACTVHPWMKGTVKVS